MQEVGEGKGGKGGGGVGVEVSCEGVDMVEKGGYVSWCSGRGREGRTCLFLMWEEIRGGSWGAE